MKKKVLSIFIIVGLSSFGFASDRFVRDDAKEVVIDTAMNLVWQDNSDTKTIKKSWEEAIDYCESLSLGGYDNWYLPNINQLYSIVDKSRYNPAIEPTFQNIAIDHYWSSTVSAENSYGAWHIDFTSGSGGWGFGSGGYYIRCVCDND